MSANQYLNNLTEQKAISLNDNSYKVDEDNFQLIWNEKELFNRAYISSIEIDDIEIRFIGRCVGKHCSYPGTIRIKLDRFNENEFTLFNVKPI
jgi:hypothetical protein